MALFLVIPDNFGKSFAVEAEKFYTTENTYFLEDANGKTVAVFNREKVASIVRSDLFKGLNQSTEKLKSSVSE
ncbi:MAG: hypothetical protein AAFV01_10680 [Bacteroidota bacterium]